MPSENITIQTKEEQDVAAAIEQLRKAMVDADGAVLSRLSDEHLTYGHSNGNIQTKTQFVDTIVSGQSDFVSIQLTDAYIKTEDNIAIARHTFIAETNDGGKPNNIKLHILWVWLLEGGEWKMIARQAVRL